VSEARRPILALVDDLFVSARIDAAARATGRNVRYVRSAADFRSALQEGLPTAILVGLAATRLPWAELIREAKADPATAGVYVLAFGPHKDLSLRSRALEAGADRVIANSAFAKALPTLLGAPTSEVADGE
jgi:DNA-binding response OmpR family regulator